MKKSRTDCRPSQVPPPPPASPPEVSVQIPLPLLSSLRAVGESFFELCVLVGQQVLAQGMEEDRTALCGPKGRHNASRRAVRWGTTASEVTLGGRRVAIERPRSRSVDDVE
jgi:putative transposase